MGLNENTFVSRTGLPAEDLYAEVGAGRVSSRMPDLFSGVERIVRT